MCYLAGLYRGHEGGDLLCEFLAALSKTLHGCIWVAQIVGAVQKEQRTVDQAIRPIQFIHWVSI